MKMFKLKTGPCEPHLIRKDIFENLTNKKPPYYGCDSEGKMGPYAVCPKCDNPIRIIGLYKKSSDKSCPYGRHHTHSVPELVEYKQKYYDDCPLASKNLCLSKDDLRDNITEFELNIYNLMRQFRQIEVKEIRNCWILLLR